MNILDPKYLKDPKLLVAMLHRVIPKEKVDGSMKMTFRGYILFEKKELCPNGTADKFAVAAGLSEEDRQRLTKQALSLEIPK